MFGKELPEWSVGTFICIFGSTLTALGLVLQKHSHTIIEQSGHEASYFLHRWWLLGFVIFFSAQIINMVAMAMTPQVVLSCLGSWTLVCNAVFAHLILDESLSSAQVVAVVGLVIAMVMVIYNAPRPDSDEPTRDGDAVHLAMRFLSPEVEVLSACFLGLLCCTRSLALGLQRAKRLRAPAASPAAALPGTEEADADAPRQILVPLSWAMLAAVAAGYTALLFKCIAEIVAGAVSRTGESSGPWYCWEAYAILGVGLLCAPTELHCLNLALQSGEAVFVIPVYLTLAMMAQLTTGAVFFREFKNFHSEAHELGFGLGVLLTVVFVVAMAKAQDDHYQSPKDHTPDLRAPLVSEPEVQEPSPAKSVTCGHTPAAEKQVVSVAGFGGAIECLEAHNRGRSELPLGLGARARLAPPGRRLTRLDRQASSPV
mmetsp:Transcript_117245/g.284341  ORF Transcript_117245/g.284341 Transcript_117245/m.284341 type:complete len:428 (+) Transcript_117245:54-1337(+)